MARRRDFTFSPGVEVRLRLVSGRLLFTNHTRKEVALSTLCVAFQSVVSQRLHVPRECVNFVWPSTHARVPQSPLEITCRICQIGSDAWEYLFKKSDICSVCCDPCDDADAPGALRGRSDSCARCAPCFLCAECYVHIKNEPVCFNCIGAKEWSFLAESQRGRAKLAGLQVENVKAPSEGTLAIPLPRPVQAPANSSSPSTGGADVHRGKSPPPQSSPPPLAPPGASNSPKPSPPLPLGAVPPAAAPPAVAAQPWTEVAGRAQTEADAASVAPAAAQSFAAAPAQANASSAPGEAQPKKAPPPLPRAAPLPVKPPPPHVSQRHTDYRMPGPGECVGQL